MRMEETAKMTFSPLTEVDLSSHDKLDILTELRKGMSQSKPREKMRFGVFPRVAAAMVAVAVAAGGVGYESHWNRLAPFTTSWNHPTLANQFTSVSEGQILTLLPKGAQLIVSDSDGDLIHNVSLGNDGSTESIAMYQYSYEGVKQIGAVIAGLKGKDVDTLWQYKGPGVGPGPGLTLTVKDVLGNGIKDVVFTGQVGAGTNYTEIISWQSGAAKTVFKTISNRLDIGRYGATNSTNNQIVTWTLDTGVLYNIQAYGWNSKDKQFEPISNSGVPEYFKNIMIPYYKNVAHSVQGKNVPKMVAFGLAQAYFNAGDYPSAMSKINIGLKLNANDYPSNREFTSLKTQINRENRTK